MHRRAKVVVRRVDPLSVLKVSVIFYLCVMLVLVLALMIVYWILGVTGVLDSIIEVLRSWSAIDPEAPFEFNGIWIFSRLFVFGLGNVILWSLVNLFVALLYNLVSDVVGGIQVTLGEKK